MMGDKTNQKKMEKTRSSTEKFFKPKLNKKSINIAN